MQFGEEAGGEDHSGDLEEGDTDADTANIHCSKSQTGQSNVLLINLNKRENPQLISSATKMICPLRFDKMHHLNVNKASKTKLTS